MNIGLKIKELAGKKNVSILQLSEKLGKSRQTTYDMLDKPHVSSEILVKLCELFNLPITYFFTEGTDFPTVEVGAGKVQVDVGAGVGVDKALAYPPEEVLKLKKALVRERKRNDRLLTIIEKQADTLKH